MLTTIRTFFSQRAVLEVETPLLCHATGTDPQLDFFSSFYRDATVADEMFLQTSPEFAMKRLLAAGSGSIFQICKAFRNGENGRFHNPEFTILEWYRVGFSLDQLIDEVVVLIEEILAKHCTIDSTYRVTYSDLFQQTTGLNPLVFCQKSYGVYASENDISDAVIICGDDHSMWLDFIFSHKIQPVLAHHNLAVVYDYPAIQSSLARINRANELVAERFEVFINGIEIGNGFFELSNADEQEQRFDQENKTRAIYGQKQVEKDQRFLDALRVGLPDCSGIALGLDRLLMILANVDALNDVLAFPFDRA